MKVLFICTANRDRSPTAEQVFRDMPGWAVRSAGTEPYGETQMTEEMLSWADRIFVMEERHLVSVVELCPSCSKKTTVLGIDDEYSRNSAKLVGQLVSKMANVVDLDESVRQIFYLLPERAIRIGKLGEKIDNFTAERARNREFTTFYLRP